MSIYMSTPLIEKACVGRKTSMLLSDEEYSSFMNWGLRVLYRPRTSYWDSYLEKFTTPKGHTLEGGTLKDVVVLLRELDREFVDRHGRLRRVPVSVGEYLIREISDSSPDPETGEKRWAVVLGGRVEVV